MSEKDIKQEQENAELQDNTASTEQNNGQEQAEETVEETGAESNAEAELAEMKDKYIRLMAEFENFRRRTARERSDLIRTANEDLMGELLPVLDDMERARQSMEATKDVDALLQGVELVFHKLKHVTQLKGLKPIDIEQGTDFDSDFHEAVTQVPAPSDELKGKIIDVIEKGYTLNDKVIRFSKVIIGA